MTAQKKRYRSKAIEAEFNYYHGDEPPNSTLSTNPCEDQQGHLNGYELHNYFSRFWTEQLSIEEEARIRLHVESCAQCAHLGRVIQVDDEELERLSVSPRTPEDKADMMRSLNVFSWVLKNMKDKEQMENSERALFLAQSTQSPLTEEEMQQVIPALAEAVTSREISQALVIVDRTVESLKTIPPLQPGAIHLLAYCAWAIDYYEPHLETVKGALERFRQIPRKGLTLSELVHLNIAEGLVMFHQEDYKEANALFKEAQDDADRSEDTELMTISRYYRGRVLWKMRHYDQSLIFIRDAISRDLAAKNHARVAAMELVEGWLLFLKGEIGSSQRVLDRASARLGSHSGAWVDLGNIRSFQGRLYREGGPEYYLKALDCFADTIEAFKDHNGGHRNVARAHINSAFVYRLMARDLDQPVTAENRDERQQQIEQLRGKAFAAIKQALTIYRFAPNRHLGALSRLHSVSALLYFDNADFAEAAAEAEHAYLCANQRGDNIGMANARIIQSKLVLDGIKGYDDPHDALRLAKDAVDYAEQTENRRVLARAYIRKGHAILELPEKDHMRAQQCLAKARKYLVPEDRDYLSSALRRLEKQIEEVSEARQRPNALVAYTTVAQMRKDIAAGHSLAEISEAYEERVARFVCAEFCDGNITKASNVLKTGARKVRRAVSPYAITEASLQQLLETGIDNRVVEKLVALKGREVQGRARFVKLLRKTLEGNLTQSLESTILSAVYRSD